MICPHCNEETDGYVGIKAENANLNLNNNCASGILNYTYTLNNAAAANPPTVIGQDNTLLNMTVGVTVAPNYHYHWF